MKAQSNSTDCFNTDPRQKEILYSAGIHVISISSPPSDSTTLALEVSIEFTSIGSSTLSFKSSSGLFSVSSELSKT